MKIKIDLTREDFSDNDKINFYDGKTIFFEPVNILPRVVQFKVWGVDIDENFGWESLIDDFESSNVFRELNKESGALTIKGFGELTFMDVIAAEIEITPYDKGTFIKKKDGELLKYKRVWNKDLIDESCFEYWLDTSIYFPYGACDFKIYTKGNVFFEFDSKDCIHYIDYLSEKNKANTFFGFLKDRKIANCSYSLDEFAH